MSGASHLVDELTARLRPIETALAQAWWDSNTHAGAENDARRIALELERRAVLADPDAFAALRAASASPDPDPLVARQVDVLRDAALANQVPEDLRRRLVELETAVEGTFNTFRGTLDGRRVDDNAILALLRSSDDSRERRLAWEASKQVGAEVADRVRELARLRNEAARALGFRDHFALALATGELDETRLLSTLAEVDRATAAPFGEWKRKVDERRAARFGVAPGELGPWHLDDPFFQDAPVDTGVDLDPLLRDADVEALTRRTYDGLGLDVRPVIAHSDLYAREAKSQHAFCIDIDREGDVRVLCNIEPNERWMETMLHELGHAVYDRGVSRELPWLLRGASHALTTEGVAMLAGRLVRDPEWLRTVLGADDVESMHDELSAARRSGLLVFARWVLVVITFERNLYADPDQDLDTLWWDLVERFQLVRRPVGRHEPDWAAKIHLAVAPVYYQNYLYGELVASQLQATINERFGGLVDRAAVGRYLTDAVFAPGSASRWDVLVERATGSALTARHLGEAVR